ncbi:MAG: Flp pilus assembly protein CpaB [Clostridiales bacterium]|nr:Flp pilus assembly protein CpaB [Clostridiales bacterium]
MKKVILFALIAALCAGALLYFYLGNVEQQKEVQVVYENIIVAAVDIPAYTTITAEMLTLKQMPEGTAHPNAARSADAVIGYVTESDLIKGEEIIPIKLKQHGQLDSGLSYVVPDGMRAVTIAVDEVSGVAGFLQRGDYVDVISFTTTSYVLPEEAKVEDPNAEETTADTTKPTQGTTVVAAQNVRVAAVGMTLSDTAASAAETSEMAYSTVTLFLTPEEAMRVIQGAKSGVIMLTLRASSDHDANEEDPVVSDSLLVPAG